MKKIFFFVSLIFLLYLISCSPKINHAPVVHSEVKNDSLMVNRKVFLGSRSEFLAKFQDSALVLEQPEDTLEMRLIALKKTRRILLVGHNNFRKEEVVSYWRKQTYGAFKDRWIWYDEAVEDITLAAPKPEFPKKF